LQTSHLVEPRRNLTGIYLHKHVCNILVRLKFGGFVELESIKVDKFKRIDSIDLPLTDLNILSCCRF
tara:strand:+ start:310 stop:510 length:201 start_codon:yes stop_codon:yes gene_type:complete